jgi:hypothetical protein
LQTREQALARELERARRELTDLKGAAPDLSLTFGDGKAHARFRVQLVTVFDDITLRRLVEEWRSKHPYISGMPDSLEIPGGQIISFKGFQGLPGFVSAADAAEYNAEVDRVCARYEAFLTLWPCALNQVGRTLGFSLVLENAGTAPADDVDVQLSTDAPGTWRDDVADLPAPPVVPRPTSTYESLLRVHTPYLSHLPTAALSRLGANVHGPNVSGEGSNHRVQYDITRVKHHVPCQLPIVYFQFDSDEVVTSFTVNVRLVAANIPKPTTGSLNVEVTRTAPVAPPYPKEPDSESPT